jgi:hypothetical protein
MPSRNLEQPEALESRYPPKAPADDVPSGALRSFATHHPHVESRIMAGAPRAVCPMYSRDQQFCRSFRTVLLG